VRDNLCALCVSVATNFIGVSMKIATKIWALVLSIILPGLGQVLTGRHRRGVVLFFAYLVFLDLAFIILPCLWGEMLLARILSKGLFISALIIWCYNIIDILRIIWWRERRSLREKKKALFGEVINLYLQNNLMQARTKANEILRIDRDDPDAFFYLGLMAKKETKDNLAQKYWTQSLVLDETEKWRWEIDNLIRLSKKSSLPAAGRPE